MFDDIRGQFFPVQIAEGITAVNCADSAEFWRLGGPLMDKIFPPFPELGAYGYIVPEDRQAKGKPLSDVFRQIHHEYHIFRNADNEIVGYSYGTMRDAQTYFMTSSGVLPAFRQRGLYSGYVRQLLKYLYALGYERVLSNHHPNNRAVVIAKLKAGFNITAVNLDERWGAQVELTYLFHEDRRKVYAEAFAMEERPIPQSHL